MFIFHNSSHSVYLSHKQTFSDRLKQPTELIVCMVIAAALNSTNLQNLINAFRQKLNIIELYKTKIDFETTLHVSGGSVDAYKQLSVSKKFCFKYKISFIKAKLSFFLSSNSEGHGSHSNNRIVCKFSKCFNVCHIYKTLFCSDQVTTPKAIDI